VAITHVVMPGKVDGGFQCAIDEGPLGQQQSLSGQHLGANRGRDGGVQQRRQVSGFMLTRSA
jgi:hypothetical protein